MVQPQGCIGQIRKLDPPPYIHTCHMVSCIQVVIADVLLSILLSIINVDSIAASLFCNTFYHNGIVYLPRAPAPVASRTYIFWFRQNGDVVVFCWPCSLWKRRKLVENPTFLSFELRDSGSEEVRTFSWFPERMVRVDFLDREAQNPATLPECILTAAQ